MLSINVVYEDVDGAKLRLAKLEDADLLHTVAERAIYWADQGVASAASPAAAKLFQLEASKLRQVFSLLLPCEPESTPIPVQ